MEVGGLATATHGCGRTPMRLLRSMVGLNGGDARHTDAAPSLAMRTVRHTEFPPSPAAVSGLVVVTVVSTGGRCSAKGGTANPPRPGPSSASNDPVTESRPKPPGIVLS